MVLEARVVLFMLALVGLSGLISASLIVVLRPLLLRYALARPNARSSHRVPTPQGGGIAVIGAALLVSTPVLLMAGSLDPSVMREFAVLAVAAVVLAAVGAWDDIRPLPAAVRLLVQVLAVTAVALSVPEGERILPMWAPPILETALVVVAGVWFVNLTNFMDGLDWITVAGFVPMLTLLAGLGAVGDEAPAFLFVAAALLGALLGFAPFNRPVARLFLGDVGSLPLGLLAGWLLLRVAGTGALTAALLLPLYYLADATITLLRRLLRGERVWEAHRSHFYQRATDNGFTVLDVVSRVFAVNSALAVLALVTLIRPEPVIQVVALTTGAVIVGLLLRSFATPRGGHA